MFRCMCFQLRLPGVGFLKGLHIIKQPRTFTHCKSSSSTGRDWAGDERALSLRCKNMGSFMSSLTTATSPPLSSNPKGKIPVDLKHL